MIRVKSSGGLLEIRKDIEENNLCIKRQNKKSKN